MDLLGQPKEKKIREPTWPCFNIDMKTHVFVYFCWDQLGVIYYELLIPNLSPVPSAVITRHYPFRLSIILIDGTNNGVDSRIVSKEEPFFDVISVCCQKVEKNTG